MNSVNKHIGIMRIAMHAQDLLVALQHIHWLRVIKNYHIRHYVWEIAKILTPALMTGFITFLAMRITDSRNKKRWLNDSFIKHKNDLIIRINKILLDFFDKFDNYFNIDNNNIIDINLVNNFFNEYDNELRDLKTLYYELLEVYNIQIGPLISTLSQLDYIKNYVKENIESDPNKLTIVPQNDTTEVSLEYYLNILSNDFVKSRNAMIKVIQNKLK